MKKFHKTFTGVAALILGSAVMAPPAWSHGFIASPASRALLCNKNINTGCGAVTWEPQSIEGDNGFPEKGPADGTLPAGGNSRFSELNQQSPTRWAKVEMHPGENTFSWALTAVHRTAGWRYFMTKPGWDTSKPLNRDAFDLTPFCQISGNNEIPPSSFSHTCTIPTDRSGYHVILAVWDIADTDRSFYQAIDVNVTK